MTYLQRDIRQIVDGGEDAQLRELRDTGDETEFYECLIGLEGYVELLHHLAHIVERFLAVRHVEQGCVVFVDDDRHLPSRLLIKPPDERVEFFSRRHFFSMVLINVQPPQQENQRPLEFLC